MDSISTVITIYVLASLCELYFFLMQRSARAIGIENEIPERVAREMLPLWYALVWPVKLVRWACLIMLLRLAGIWAAVAAFAAVFTVSMFVPVPHWHFFPMFKKQVTKAMPSGNTPKLWLALLQTEGKHGPQVKGLPQ